MKPCSSNSPRSSFHHRCGLERAAESSPTAVGGAPAPAAAPSRGEPTAVELSAATSFELYSEPVGDKERSAEQAEISVIIQRLDAERTRDSSLSLCLLRLEVRIR